MVKRGSEEGRVGGGMSVVGAGGRWWMYWLLYRFPGILHVCMCVCVSPGGVIFWGALVQLVEVSEDVVHVSADVVVEFVAALLPV